METMTVGGIPVEVHISGSGPPLLYLHAEMLADRVRPNLDALASKHRVIAPHHPGFGPNAPVPADFTSVADIAYLYLDLIDRLGLDRPILVGASLGGWIALEMAVRNPKLFSKLVLISSVGVKFSGREDRDFADLFYLPDAQAFPALFADPARFAPDYARMSEAEVQAYARERQSMAYYAWRPYMHNPGLKRWLHRVDLPTLVLWGAQDQFVKPDYGRRLAEALPRARFEEISGAGHYPQIEQPDAVVRAIEAF